MTIQQLWVAAAKQISEHDVRTLLAFTTDIAPKKVLDTPGKKLGWRARRRFWKAVRKRASGIPIPYITGIVPFAGLLFRVDKHVLIPRSTTERLVEEAKTRLQHGLLRSKQKPLFIDIGTGCGNIPVSLLANNPNFRQRVSNFAIDISKKALTVTQANAKLHNIELTLMYGSLLTPLTSRDLIPHTAPVIITAHLPYLTDAQLADRHEPIVAMRGEGTDGTYLYRTLFVQLEALRKKQTSSLDVLIECGPKQMDQLKQFITKHLPTATLEIEKDPDGHNRYIFVHVDSV